MFHHKTNTLGGNMSRQPAGSQYTPEALWPIFHDYLSQAVIEGFLRQRLQRFYRRLFPPWLVVWGFVLQRLHADHSCDAFVSFLHSDQSGVWRKAGQRMAESTSAYCQARKRLPLGLAHDLLHQTAVRSEAEWEVEGQWCGRQVYLVDGSTLRLPASEELLHYYGQPNSGRGISYWPVMRVMVAFHYWSGLLREVIEAPHAASEYAMAVQLMHRMPSQAVLVLDQMFSIYRIVQVAYAQQLDVLVRMQAKNVQRWLRQYHVGPNQEVRLCWSPSPADHPEMGVPQAAIPGRLVHLQLERDGFRPMTIYLFTTLLDPQRYGLQDIARLYGWRWRVELDLRHVKTTLKMEALAGKSLDMVRKELWLGLLAYNLLRVLMLKAALAAGIPPLRLSLAACWRRIHDTALALPTTRPAPSLAQADACLSSLLTRLAQCRLPVRKHPRHEPRAIRGRPQNFPYLRGSRQTARSAALVPFSLES
jgi:hypothetical protein